MSPAGPVRCSRGGKTALLLVMYCIQCICNSRCCRSSSLKQMLFCRWNFSMYMVSIVQKKKFTVIFFPVSETCPYEYCTRFKTHALFLHISVTKKGGKKCHFFIYLKMLYTKVTFVFVALMLYIIIIISEWHGEKSLN